MAGLEPTRDLMEGLAQLDDEAFIKHVRLLKEYKTGKRSSATGRHNGRVGVSLTESRDERRDRLRRNAAEAFTPGPRPTDESLAEFLDAVVTPESAFGPHRRNIILA